MINIDEITEDIRNNERKRIALKLITRANYLLKNCKDVDSPMILVGTELEIQAEEIFAL